MCMCYMRYKRDYILQKRLIMYLNFIKIGFVSCFQLL